MNIQAHFCNKLVSRKASLEKWEHLRQLRSSVPLFHRQIVLIDIESRKNWHSLIGGQIIFRFHRPFLVIFLIWIFRALQKIVFEHFFIMDRFCRVQKYDWLIFDRIFVAWLNEILQINQISKWLNAIKPCRSLKNKLESGFAIKVFRLALDSLSNNLCRSIFEVV